MKNPETPYQDNAVSIILHKSGRKNAKCSDVISANHLIDASKADRKISDDRILQHFISKLDGVVTASLSFNGYLDFSVYGDFFKCSEYVNVNGETVPHWDPLRLCWDRVVFHSVEQAINFLFSVFCLIYPYNRISTRTLYSNPSIKYQIRRYYGGER